MRCAADRLSGARRTCLTSLLLAYAIFFGGNVCSDLRAAELLELPPVDSHVPIAISAQQGARWTEGSYDVWLLQGNCSINQGETMAHSGQAVLWIEHAAPGNPLNRVICYLEDDVQIKYHADGPISTGGDWRAPLDGKPRPQLTDKNWFGRVYSLSDPQIQVAQTLAEPAEKPAVYQNARRRRDPPQFGTIQRTQYAEFDPRQPLNTTTPAPQAGAAARRVRVFPRGGAIQAQSFPGATPNQVVAVVTSGVNIIVDGLPGAGAIDVSADRVVIWTESSQGISVSNETLQHPSAPLEFYLEGNVEFRQDDRLIKAQALYYDVRNELGTVLAADVISPVPSYAGLIRVRSQIVQMVDRSRIVATDATITTSLLGEPSYAFRSGELTLTDSQQPIINPVTGQQDINPETGQGLVVHDYLVTGRNNVTYVEGLPVAYWPVFATDLKRPTFYINKLEYKSDTIFGQQILTEFDTYQLLGIRRPPTGTDWDVSLDYYSKRGIAVGTTFKYDTENVIPGLPGHYSGLIDLYEVHDTGLDNLSIDRYNIQHPGVYRGRQLIQSRGIFADGWSLTAELGLISDQNFLQQYFQREWDNFKDEDTRIELKKLYENQSFSISAQARVNPFFMDNEDLPRLDHYWLGQSFLNDYFTYYEHSQIGYKHLLAGGYPPDAADQAKFGLLPYEANRNGEVLSTTQEIDLPLQLGPVKVVPYALGQLTHYGEALDGNDLNRAFGQLGIRASLPLESVDPTVQSELFNLNGLAHKIVFGAELSYSQATQDVNELPLYDQIDDNAQEQFRRRSAFDTFGGPPATAIPQRFDPRSYAIRYGLQDSVSSPSNELYDDLSALRLDIKQRWQTKRGGAGHEHIIDWISLDTGLTIFDADENFGQNVGLINYDFSWHVGDRTTLVSDGLFDTFSQGERMFTVGAFITRPPRGNLYVGFRSLEGPITSNAIQVAYNYRMSPKWIGTIGTSYDFSASGDIGEHVSLTRIGESFLATLEANVDSTRGTFGVRFALEPRFLPRSKITRTTGLIVPPAGAYGLE